MKASINTIRFINQHYQSAGEPAPDGVEALSAKIGAQLGAIEEVIDIGSKYNGALIVRIVSCEQHPNADRLHICRIDDGGKATQVMRDEQGYVQVICGAPNVRAGMHAVWLAPGVTVPNTYDKDPFVLEARELRGQMSNGMMASPKELGLGDSHEGILEVDIDAAPGTSFAEAYDLVDDYVLDIENKMFTHRPDCFGFLGIAREIAGIQQQPYHSPAWYQMRPDFPEIEGELLPLTVRNEVPELVPRFTAMVLRDVTIRPSPVWLQISLAKLGVRSINNIVDYTNFFMLKTGQPLHAYDYDKLKAQDANAERATMVIRYPNRGEKIVLLNGKEVEPRAEAIMIATEDKLIGIGGVMGGADTEVDEHTRNIVIECATFNMYSIRRTSMAHGLFTDAVSRFNKGQSPLQNLAVLARIIDEIRQFAGGKVASSLIDDNHLPDDMLTRGSVHPAITITPSFINSRLGIDLSVEAISQLLENIECKVTQDGEALCVQAPFWRTDIEIREDVVEEVGRLYGYDKLPLRLPMNDITPASKDRLLSCKSEIRHVLARAGANEVLTYSFVHGDLLDKVGQDRTRAFRLANALSPDLQYYRLSILPSLLEKVHANNKTGYDTFALFELGKTHSIAAEQDKGVPNEAQSLGLVFAASQKAAQQNYGGAAYYEARAYLDTILSRFDVKDATTIKPLAGADLRGDPRIIQMAAPFEPNRSAILQDTNGRIWGVIGEFKPSICRDLKLPAFCAGFEIDPLLFMQDTPAVHYVQLPRFPKVTQDLCLKVTADIAYQQLFACVSKALTQSCPVHTHVTLSPVDIFQRPDDVLHKQITLRLTVASYERTLTDHEVAEILDRVASAAKAALGAERV